MGSPTRTAAHFAVRAACKPSQLAFEKSLARVEETQMGILRSTLERVAASPSGQGIRADWSLEDFQRQLPVSDYSSWEGRIEEQRRLNKPILTNEFCDRYQPTSGSTSRMKWIPYNAHFLKQCDQAIGPWMSDLYGRFPAIRDGRHFWSISWVPTALREKIAGNVNDDSKLLPWWKSIFMSLTMAVPQNVAQAASSDASVFASLCYLVATEDLTVISVWSPTFALNFFEQMALYRESLAESLEKGEWNEIWREELSFLRCPKSSRNAALLRAWDGRLDAAFFCELWPSLGLISSWATSSSKTWAQKLHALLPKAHFQGKGLLATEGVVTFPYRDQYPLAITSHFFEFRDLDNDKILPAWKLKKGQEVQPILTTGNGLLRYAMKDRMIVDGFLGACPSFEFLGRLDGVDLVGEKMAPEMALQVLKVIERESRTTAVSLFALSPAAFSPAASAKPRYLALMEGKANPEDTARLSKRLEEQLLSNFHYSLARDLDQLGPALVCVNEKASEIYYSLGWSKGMVTGNMKVEPLMIWDRELHPVLLELTKPKAGERKSAARRSLPQEQTL